MSITFLDLLGFDWSGNISAAENSAAALWPNDIASLTPGINLVNDSLQIVKNLQDGLAFTNFRPGADPAVPLGNALGQISFSADVQVTGSGLLTQNPFYLRALPDLAIWLLPTAIGYPATCFCSWDGRGVDCIIDRLPVRLKLKVGVASISTPGPASGGTFDPTKDDTLAYTLGDENTPAEIDILVRIQLTPDKKVLLEPTVPISFGKCRFMGLPANAVYDVQLIPSPDWRELYEWTRNDISAFISNPPAKGAIGFRSLDVDFSQSPFKELMNNLQTRAANSRLDLGSIDLVLEDVVVPVAAPMLPVPSHGVFGIRRKIKDRNDIANAFSFAQAPITFDLDRSTEQGGSGGGLAQVSIEKLLFATGSTAPTSTTLPFLDFEAALVFESTSGNKIAGTVEIDSDYTLILGLALGDQSPAKFTVAGTTIMLAAVRGGVSFGRMLRQIQFKDSFELLGDFAITSPTDPPSGSFFQLKSLANKPLNLVIRDLGWKMGNPSVSALQMPDGIQLVFVKKVSIVIQEMGWVNEPNGTPYFSFSGGVIIGFGGGDNVKPNPQTGETDPQGFGILVRRLRFRTNNDHTQPEFKLDGISLYIKAGTVVIQGFGYITRTEADGWSIREWGFGVSVQFDALAATFLVAAEFIKGQRQRLDDPSNEFSYFLAALALGYLPAGPVAVYDIILLLAYNMAPSLDSQFPDGEGMALLSWYQNHPNSLILAPNRGMNDWTAQQDALSFGVGCGFSFNGGGNLFKIDIFIFFSKSNADTGILIVGDLFLLKNPKPIAFIAIEYDISQGKFGLMAGVNLNLGNFFPGTLPSWLEDIAAITGSLYFGNQPWAFAIGQLADQRTWLGVHVDVWIIKFQFAVCVQIVDGGPKGFGIVATVGAGSDFGIGAFVLFGSFGFVAGTWKTGSDTSGIEAWLGFGFKIDLFFVFNFGADITVKVIYLGKHPWYTTLSAELRIDTPWFLPDVTFHVDKTWGEQLPFDTSTVTQGLASADGTGTGQPNNAKLLSPGLSDNVNDPKHLYTFNELMGLSGIRYSDTHAMDLPVISTDATLALNFTQPVSNDSLIASSTYDGSTDPGVQQVQDLQLRYGLQSIGIRRSPCFGPNAGSWSDLIKDSDTQFTVSGAAPETITFAWDVDSRADGKMSPTRLLINSDSPYSFAISAPQNDEEAQRNDPGVPCCRKGDGRRIFPPAHYLQFGDLAVGSRTPTGQQFSNQGAWWSWQLRPTPVICAGVPAFIGENTALFSAQGSTIIGFADSSDPIATAQAAVAWDSMPATLYFEGYYGLELVAQQIVDLSIAGSVHVTCRTGLASAGMTRIQLRLAPRQEPPIFLPLQGSLSVSGTPPAGLALLGMGYFTLADLKTYVAGETRCGNASNLGPPTSDAKGKLAFLPNHDYEVVVTTQLVVTSKSQGPRSLTLSEAFYFRTKGLPGLNAASNPGDDLRDHVEGTYPLARAIPIYREEPVVLSFTEGMSSVLPIDRNPAPGDAPERLQMFPLILNVDRVVSLDGSKRLTVPSYDWITAHRTNPIPYVVTLATPHFAVSKVRRATSLNPRILRYEAFRAAVPECGVPHVAHASQVLLHEPIDADGNPGPWEAQTEYRATVRQEDGPYAERSGFDWFDLTAFIQQADGSAGASWWTVDSNGHLVSPNVAGGRQYLSCGELQWDHLQVQARLDLQSATAGIAVGVQDGVPVPAAILATVESTGSGHDLVLRRRDSNGEAELGRASVTIQGAFTIQVIAFDDNVRAVIGKVVVEGPRKNVRAGRVALVAQGAAAFYGLLVDGLDMFTFNFRTSRFNSFQEHIQSFDGRLGALSAGSFGEGPAAMATVLAQHGSQIPPLMAPTADPQERQRLFSTIVAAMGIGLRKDPLKLEIARLSDANGSYGLLLESPDPISFTRDVTAILVRHVLHRVPPKFANIPILSDVATLSPLRPPEPDPVTQIPSDPSLSLARFDAGRVIMPKSTAAFPPQTLLVRAVEGKTGTMLEVFDAPRADSGMVNAEGVLRGIVPQAQAPKRPELAATVGLAPGDVAILHAGGIIGGVWKGGWVYQNIPVPVVPLSNGSETVILLLSADAAPLPAGKYTLKLILNRARWRGTGPQDPEQNYHQECTVDLSW